MKKIMMIIVILIITLFTNVKYNEKEAKDNSLITLEYLSENNTENKQTIELGSKLCYEETYDYIEYTFEDYLLFIGIKENQLIEELGQPEETFYLYGGLISMYHKHKIGFGIDEINHCINTVLIYEGRILNNIEIGMDKKQVLNLLNYNKGKYNYSEGEGNYSITVEYEEYIIYLHFSEDILNEILIKLQDY